LFPPLHCVFFHITHHPPQSPLFPYTTLFRSNTLMVGEKHVPPYALGYWPLDCAIYDGHNPICNTRGGGPSFPLAASDVDAGWKLDRKSTRLNSSHLGISYAVFCLKKKTEHS